MKYGKYLIVTLPDFRRHFDYKQFIKNKDQFVIDMHPDKVYYWDDDELMSAYHNIARWIVNNPSCKHNNMPSDVHKSLKLLTGIDTFTDTSSPLEDDVKLTESIISLSPGQDVILPEYSQKNLKDGMEIHLHKFCMAEDGDSTCSITIGNETREIGYGEVLYATEISQEFVDFTLNMDENQFLKAQMIDSPGSFGSILVITDKVNGTKHSVSGVTSFILVGNGYIYINENGKLISIENDTPMVLLRKKELNAVQIKSKRDVIDVLYSNGVCKSNNSMTQIFGVSKI